MHGPTFRGSVTTSVQLHLGCSPGSSTDLTGSQAGIMFQVQKGLKYLSIFCLMHLFSLEHSLLLPKKSRMRPSSAWSTCLQLSDCPEASRAVLEPGVHGYHLATEGRWHNEYSTSLDPSKHTAHQRGGSLAVNGGPETGGSDEVEGSIILRRIG
jgi:hypothetical protein